jgi:GTP-binding protein
MSLPVVAVVGRPNVGKSSFFNVIAGERVSIVDSTPGVTRDRVGQVVDWLGRRLFLIDTGGIEPKTDDEMKMHMRIQAELAIDMADVVIFITDLKDGLTAADLEIGQMLRRAQKKVVVAVNKADHVGDTPPGVYEFYQLGFEHVQAMSAAHKLGLGEVMDLVLADLADSFSDEEDERIKVAIIGRPNVGKSSLVNRLLGEDRAIVSPVAGTTRDAIDAPLEDEAGSFLLIDTAGLRRRGRIERGIEKYAMIRAMAAIERADVCIVLIDGSEGIAAQDTKVAGYAHNAGKSTILLVNKWDIADKERLPAVTLERQICARFPFMAYAPVLFASAATGYHIGRLLPLVAKVYESAHKQIGTGVLNGWLADTVAMHETPQDKGRHLKIYYTTQVGTAPPTFVFFVNDPKLSHFSYERYLENRLRDSFGFEGTPIRLILRGRGEDDDASGRNVRRRRREQK